jgi:beta-glucosidase
LITEAEIDNALGHVLTARFRLGLFDPPDQVPYAQIPFSQNDTFDHRMLALKVASESIVLLKNDGILPLDRKKIHRIAVIGVNASSFEMLLGNYNGDPSVAIPLLDGITSAAGPNIDVTYEPGCPLALRADNPEKLDPRYLDAAVQAAKSADVVIYVGGINSQLEGEEMRVNYEGFSGGDRTRIELPAPQTQLLKLLQATGKPVVFVNCSGSAVAMPWEAAHIPAIVQAWYPGEEGGRAVAEMLFGKTNPAGRLPVTFYRSTDDLPAFDNYAMSNRTYRYFSGKPLFAFGHGLSYTRFDYRRPNLTEGDIAANGSATLKFELENAGKMGGDEVAQVYFRHVQSAVPQPIMALCGFKRVHLGQGEKQTITFEISASRLRYWDTTNKKYIVEAGSYEFLIGAASDDIRLRVPFKVRSN